MKLLDILTDESNRKTTMVLGLVVAMIVILAVITYFFFYNNDTTYTDTELPSTDEILAQHQVVESNTAPVIDSTNSIDTLPQNTSIQNSQDAIQTPVADSNPVNSQPVEAPTPVVDTKNTKPSTTNTISSLKYTIKPLDMNIVTCDTMRNGRWNMPKICLDSVVSSIQKLIETNAELIALEVSGIVDNNPYAGPSAELKQEGLASFRAREAIGVITRNFSNVAAFEGPSKELPNKRGFEIKAYYLQN